MAAKESKKTIKAYNRLAQTLLEFEALWYAAWVRSVDSAAATLQVRASHHVTGLVPLAVMLYL